MQIPKIRVRIGEWDFSTTGESHAHIERKVTRKVVHPKYNFFTYENDLALVRLEKKVPFQPNIVPICLPGNDDLLIGKSSFNDKFNLMCREDDFSNKFSMKKVKLHEAFIECFESLINTFGAKMMNPLEVLGLKNCLSWDITHFQKQVTKNC